MRAAVEIPMSASGLPSTACVIAVCIAEILGLAGYSLVPALLPQFIDAWSLSSTQAGWLAGSLFAAPAVCFQPPLGIRSSDWPATIASNIGASFSRAPLALPRARTAGRSRICNAYVRGLWPAYAAVTRKRR